MLEIVIEEAHKVQALEQDLFHFSLANPVGSVIKNTELEGMLYRCIYQEF